jgi:hypothetical protein
MAIKPSTLRKKLLKDRGLTVTKPDPHKHTKLLPSTTATIANKTAKMMYLEMKYGVSIEDTLLTGSLNFVVKTYGGEVDRSTVSKWIKKYKMRYSADNLPSCDGCKHKSPTCLHPYFKCTVLYALGMWELVKVKEASLLESIELR